jgi:hypothetical protein
MKTRALFLVPLLALLGCAAKTNAPIEVVALCAPPDDPKVCSFADECDAQYIGWSAIDLDETNFLWAIIQVNNQAANNGNTDIGRVNTADAWVQEARVEFSGANVSESRYPILGTAYVPADGSSVISVLAISEAVAAEFAALVPPLGTIDVVGTLRLRGVYADTTEFETGDFEIPIRVCRGCVGALVGCPEAGDVVFTCPPNPGQLPARTACAAP